MKKIFAVSLAFSLCAFFSGCRDGNDKYESDKPESTDVIIETTVNQEQIVSENISTTSVVTDAEEKKVVASTTVSLNDNAKTENTFNTDTVSVSADETASGETVTFNDIIDGCEEIDIAEESDIQEVTLYSEDDIIELPEFEIEDLQ